MPSIQFGFTMPADQLDKAQRTTFVADLNRALKLISGHFDSAWFIDHLQFGDADQLEGFTALSYMAALHPHLKFGHTVLCQSFRNPALLAKWNASQENVTVSMRTTLTLWAHRCNWLSRCAPLSKKASIISCSTVAGFQT